MRTHHEIASQRVQKVEYMRKRSRRPRADGWSTNQPTRREHVAAATAGSQAGLAWPGRYLPVGRGRRMSQRAKLFPITENYTRTVRPTRGPLGCQAARLQQRGRRCCRRRGSRHPTGNSPPQPTGNASRHVTSGIHACHEMPAAAEAYCFSRYRRGGAEIRYMCGRAVDRQPFIIVSVYHLHVS